MRARACDRGGIRVRAVGAVGAGCGRGWLGQWNRGRTSVWRSGIDRWRSTRCSGRSCSGRTGGVVSDGSLGSVSAGARIGRWVGRITSHGCEREGQEAKSWKETGGGECRKNTRPAVVISSAAAVLEKRMNRCCYFRSAVRRTLSYPWRSKTVGIPRNCILSLLKIFHLQ
jgi:hypothetical protein